MSRKPKIRLAGHGLATLLVAMVLAMAICAPTVAQDAAPGFNGYIQSGTCAAPTEDVWVELDFPRSDFAVEPYLAKVDGEDATVTLAYFGAPLAPGFGYSTLFTDQEVFSLVMTDPESGEPVACGDILEPDDENFAQIGIALIRLEPVGATGLQGYAIIERTETSRELVIIPTRVRILLTAGPTEIAAPAATPVAATESAPASTPAASPVASPETSS